MWLIILSSPVKCILLQRRGSTSSSNQSCSRLEKFLKARCQKFNYNHSWLTGLVHRVALTTLLTHSSQFDSILRTVWLRRQRATTFLPPQPRSHFGFQNLSRSCAKYARQSGGPQQSVTVHSTHSEGVRGLGPVLAYDGHHAEVHELRPLHDVLEGGHEVGGEGLVDEPPIEG